MTEQPPNLYTDRGHLRTKAYGDSGNLQARANIYSYQQPRVDLQGWVLDQVVWRGDERVADIGCGPGSYLKRLAQDQPGVQLIGIDLSRGMLADLEASWDTARSRPRLLVADVQALPLPDAHCDVVLAMHMLYHVPDIEQAARELRRVVHPGGQLLAVTNAAEHTQEIHELYEASLSAIGGPATHQQKGSERFASENGAALLGTAFASVERRDVRSTLVITDPEPVVRYIASSREMREPNLPAGITWDMVMAEVERRTVAAIAEHGAFRIQTAVSLFVCS